MYKNSVFYHLGGTVLQKERFHLVEQLEEGPSSGDEVVSPRKRMKFDHSTNHHNNHHHPLLNMVSFICYNLL